MKSKQSKMRILGTKIAEITSIIVAPVSFILLIVFLFSQWAANKAYNNNLELYLKNTNVYPKPDSPYDYSTLIVCMVILLLISVATFAICEVSHNIYHIGKMIENNNFSPALPPQPQEPITPKPTSHQAEPYTLCLKCGAQNKPHSTFCSECGEKIE